MAKTQFQQEPMAIIGFACRLPGGNNSPQKLWSFLEDGGIAPNTVPPSRFNFAGHWDGSHKPGTMRPAGGMFLSDTVDLARFDAGFFEVSGADATAMDPNQRQMLEVVYEGLENAGIPLEKLNGEPVACYVGSYATDYLDMMQRDAEDRAPGFLIGTGRAVMANRISYFLNIKGPSVTLDTACSGSLVGLDLACRSLQAGEVNMAIVTASNLYLNPDHVMDMGSVGQAHSPTALCHSFDASADGYCKAEAVGCLLVKRLSDAVRDRDPIRAIVRGTASNSNGRGSGTGLGGIAQPSGEMQAAAIRAAYKRAGITNFNDTAFLECHGTGTPAGDPEEVHGAGSVFSPTRDAQRPLVIGSIKANIGHSEPSAGISGLIKAILAMEKGIIPGNPTFWKPSPKIDFAGSKVKVTRTAIAWPDEGYPVRRASVNSFGFGGSNAHAVVDQPSKADRQRHLSSYRGEDEDKDEEFADDDAAFHVQSPSRPRPYTLVISANDAVALKANVSALCDHVANLGVNAPVADVAYTLSERRSRLWHRAFATIDTTDNLDESAFAVGKKTAHPPKIGLVFTGQGAQWPQMGKELLATFPQSREVLRELDGVLKAQPDPPAWSLEAELSELRSADHLRQPEFSQPLVTALQICILTLLQSWGVKSSAAVGHSSGEIAAAYAAGFLDRAGAIKAAFYRGRAALNCNDKAQSGVNVGMLAVGLGADQAGPFLEKHRNAWIACFNSPGSITVSGHRETLEVLAEEIKAAGHFARLLQVDLAYHSPLMGVIGDEYGRLLLEDREFKPLDEDKWQSDVTMFSSVTAGKKATSADYKYWTSNMVSPVRFAEALKDLVASEAPDVLIEVGPSGALAGPVAQVLKDQSLSNGSSVVYHASWARGSGAVKALLDVAGRLFAAGAPIDMAAVNGGYATQRTIVDLPNYQWNHGARYWHENATSVEWRNKRYITHDLLGSKIPGTSWKAPTWRKKLSLADVPWLKDHQMGSDVLVPGMAFAAMALEAMYQKHCSLHPEEAKGIESPSDLAYRFRNVKFDRAVVVEEGKPTTLLLTLANVPGGDEWHEFRVRTTAGENQDLIYEHCKGLVRVQEPLGEEHALQGDDLAPLRDPQSAEPWYKLQREMGSHFGPSFRKIKQWETVSGQRTCRASLSLEPPSSAWDPQSSYPIHPAVLDVCQQTATAAFLAGERSTLKDVIILSEIDDMVVNRVPRQLKDGLSVAEAVWTGRGREELVQSWSTNVAVHDPDSGALYVRFRGLNYVRLDVEEKPDLHVFDAVRWKPDITHMSQDQLLYLEPTAGSRLDEVIDLVAHKTPRLSVLEISLDDGELVDQSSLWLQGGSSASQSARAAFAHYTFAVPDAQILVDVESANSGRGGNIELHLLAPNQDDLGLPSSGLTYDLAIVKAPTDASAQLDSVLGKLKRLLKPDAFILVVTSTADVAYSSPSSDAMSVPGSEMASENNNPVTPDSGSETPAKSASSSTTTLDFKQFPHDAMSQRLSNDVWGPDSVMQVLGTSFRAYLCSNSGGDGDTSLTTGEVLVVRFNDATPPLSPTIRRAIEASGYTVSDKSVEELGLESAESSSSSSLSPMSALLVMDELVAPVLTDISQSNWEKLKKLVSSGKPILWVTKGAQTDRVNNPENAMVQGLFRVARREDPGVRLTTLDVQNPSSPAAHWAIERVLRTVLLAEGAVADHEYAERDGMLLVPRIVVDESLNRFKAADMGAGFEPVVKDFHSNAAQIRFQADKKGSLESLAWCETAAGDVPIAPGKLDIKVMAMGVNFKDVATTMGIVPENEHMIGCECSGYIRRVGPGVTGFKVGDRVVAQTNGTYVNHLQVVSDRVHVIPDSMGFEDAATIPLVYLTAIYSLYHLGNLQEGQSVLIHSAAGGVGMAAIQLAQYKKCDVFVTVSTDDKRALLASQFNIPANRMFSSRNTKFAEQIRRETRGRGVDVILNSLIGELLDESWRLTADGGVMVEIGKRDIVDRNTLAMEPFDRNCSFRAVDLSYVKQISDSLTGKLLREVFDLVRGGHVGPIHPVTTFPLDEAVAALSYIRRGQHMGKIVISCNDQEAQLPIRPVMPKLELKPDVAYLIVGGLKGLCGSLAVHMARHGARHIIAMSRSGISDEASARVVRNCASYGCHISEAKGDVSEAKFVLSVFQSSRSGMRIAGVIQAAMVLRDRPYEMMTHEDFHTATKAKLAGTWNLHMAAQQDQQSPLDFFTMLSSISSVVGNKGQTNYAAANSFMDAFSFYRQGQGLRAHTVDLGLIEDVGYVAEVGGAALEARFDKREWTPINEGMLRRILSYSIMQQVHSPGSLSAASAAQTVTGIAYPLPLDQSDLADNRRFGYLFTTATSNAEGGGGNEVADQTAQAIRAFRIMREAGGADVAALAKATVPLLQGQITKLLRLETEMEPGKPPMAYGLDSLSAVELRSWVRQKLGGELSTLDITNASSLIALCEKLAAKLPKLEAVAAEA
ncbi:Uu.00g024490.m01.CDS01 [Anthostomella pinea]|uniref:Uu.00g024490.m01.CDS01 n=1 Tax=Anthostomella pinea TaxID=933095 RepID=A0AAI8YR51_9PEZI|nr:Uu.00g024490.m01.CDS01 [Anthostomella pinea]